MDDNTNTFSIIPTMILDDKRLSANEILLYARINSLVNKTGYCFASNKYLAEKCNTTDRTIKRWLKNLKDTGYIDCKYIYKENLKEVKERHIFTYKFVDLWKEIAPLGGDTDVPGWGHQFHGGGDTDVPDNNISLNNINLSNKEKEILYKEKEVKKQGKKHFIKPTLEEVKTYCWERHNSVDPILFFDFYESKGWVVGKNPMKDWKAAVRTWERSDKRKGKTTYVEDHSPKYTPATRDEDDDFDYMSIYNEQKARFEGNIEEAERIRQERLDKGYAI